MTWIIIPIGLVLLAAIGYFLDREIWFHEGARLGPRMQSWLYDRWAIKYDQNKHDSQQNDAQMLAQPVVDALSTLGAGDVLMLDIATGTGRVPLTMLSHPDFRGQIIALDISENMLRQARAKLADHLDRVDLLHHQAQRLPFNDATFDAVSCVEALIIMPNLEQPLAEIARVLKPGGLFLTTHSLEVYPAKRRELTQDEYADILRAAGFTAVQFESWWKKFERVIALREGTFQSSGSAPQPHAVLHCPNCDQTALNSDYRCANCGHSMPRHDDILTGSL